MHHNAGLEYTLNLKSKYRSMTAGRDGETKIVRTRTVNIYSEAKINRKMARDSLGMHLARMNN